ncbi:hypothetical protein MRB53_041700 [Persea americana]|nr:hypothetical protein MRB53_041700 [Persea americana]
MFTSLASDSSSGTTIVSIEEAMSTILAAVSRIKLTDDEQTALEDLLVSELSSTDLSKPQEGFAAHDSRHLAGFDILAIGAADEKMEVKEEGERGLSPYWYHMLSGEVLAKKTRSLYSFQTSELSYNNCFLARRW